MCDVSATWEGEPDLKVQKCKERGIKESSHDSGKGLRKTSFLGFGNLCRRASPFNIGSNHISIRSRVFNLYMTREKQQITALKNHQKTFHLLFACWIYPEAAGPGSPPAQFSKQVLGLG